MEHLKDNNCDICLIQETYLKDADTAKIQEIRDYGWNILSNPRKHRSGGGIAVLYRRHIKLMSNENVKKFNSYQVMEAVLCTKTSLVRLVNVYRPPYSKKARYTESVFLEKFGEYLGDLSNKPGQPIIAGDFNIHVEKPTEFYPKKFRELLDNYNLKQYVPLVPTHDLGGTLDLVITTEEIHTEMGPINVIESGTSSDHYLVYFDVNLELALWKEEEPKSVSYRKFNTIDLGSFKKDILESTLSERETWDSYALDDTVTLYNSVLTELMDKHCPIIERKIKKNNTPWIDEELRILRRKRRAAERAWRKDKGKRKDYIELRNKFTDQEKEKRCTYNKMSLKASSGDTKTLYKKVNRLLGNEAQDLPSYQDPAKLSEDFKDFFAEKVNSIRSHIEEELVNTNDAVDMEEDTGPSVTCRLECFSPITLDELKMMIAKMSNKFCCLDPIPSHLLKQCVDELSPILLQIVNLSITSAHFPAEMKKAVIKPTLKKDNADTDCLSNYRPVSNLPATSKLLERVILDQLNKYLSDNHLHCPVQSGYRPHHSCETLLVRMADDIRKEIQADNIVIVVLLDLSAAFDTIDHSVLLNKLLNDFGICGSAHNWFKSYLQNRCFSVKVGNSFSTFLSLLFGVPQGSLLGPILFILYIKLLQKIASKYGLSIQLYADDSQLYISFYPSRPSELQNITERTNMCLAEIKSWMIENFMKLNESKTELLVLGKPLVLQKFDLEVTIQFGNTTITPTPCKGDNWKSLGVKLDAALNMERQIDSVKQKCSWTMTNLRTIGRYLDIEVKLMLVKQLIISKLDYCNSLYMNLPNVRLKKLKSILNGGIRFIYNTNDRSKDLVPYYKRAHILPIEERIFFKVCLLSYKIVYNMAPQYLKELVEMDVPTESSKITRAKPMEDHLRMKLPKMCRTKASGRRFTNYAPEAWNSLPLRIRTIKNIETFKGMLKNYLFESMGNSS